MMMKKGCEVSGAARTKIHCYCHHGGDVFLQPSPHDHQATKPRGRKTPEIRANLDSGGQPGSSLAQYGRPASLVFRLAIRSSYSGLLSSARKTVKPDLENDFKIQQSLLLALIHERMNLADGSNAAAEIDRQISKVENNIRSYQVVKLYEQQA
jgi:hypothetical protein